MKKRYEEYLKEFIGKRSPGKGSYEPIKMSVIQVTEKKNEIKYLFQKKMINRFWISLMSRRTKKRLLISI